MGNMVTLHFHVFKRSLCHLTCLMKLSEVFVSEGLLLKRPKQHAQCLTLPARGNAGYPKVCLVTCFTSFLHFSGGSVTDFVIIRRKSADTSSPDLFFLQQFPRSFHALPFLIPAVLRSGLANAPHAAYPGLHDKGVSKATTPRPQGKIYREAQWYPLTYILDRGLNGIMFLIGCMVPIGCHKVRYLGPRWSDCLVRRLAPPVVGCGQPAEEDKDEENKEE